MSGKQNLQVVNSERSYIYALTDPDMTEVRYVGQSINPQSRLVYHCRYPGNTRLWGWINSFRPVRPGMIILEECDKSEALERETFWIEVYKATGANLLNVMGMSTAH